MYSLSELFGSFTVGMLAMLAGVLIGMCVEKIELDLLKKRLESEERQREKQNPSRRDRN